MHKFSNNVNVSLVALAEIFAVVIIDEIMHTITQLILRNFVFDIL
jgi:hypothetical protein